MSHRFEDLTSVAPNLSRMDFDNSDPMQYAKRVAKELTSIILADAVAHVQHLLATPDLTESEVNVMEREAGSA